jgi:peptide chain release factor 2
MVTIDKITELTERLEALKGYLDIEEKRGRILEEEKYTLDPDFWNDQKKAQVVMHKIRELKRWVGLYEGVKREIDDLEVTFEFFKAKEVSEDELDAQFKKAGEALEELEFKNMLSAEEDPLSAVVQITSGAGGTESNDWALMLLRMYRMWAEKNGYNVKVLDYQDGEACRHQASHHRGERRVRLRHAERRERRTSLGPHQPLRQQRRRHTSFVSVYVYPAGGRDHRDRHQSGGHHLGYLPQRWCRWPEREQGGDRCAPAPRTHGIIIENTETRSQLDNKTKALQLLKSQLYEAELERRRSKRSEIEAGKKKIEWGSQIRNYVLQPYKLVKDVRTEHETSSVDDVLNGYIDELPEGLPDASRAKARRYSGDTCVARSLAAKFGLPNEMKNDMEYRIEKDTMGEVKVPADKYWGAQTERSRNNFRSAHRAACRARSCTPSPT